MAESRALREFASGYGCAGSPGFSGILGAAKALAHEFLAVEAFTEQADAQWLRDLGIPWRLDYGSRRLHTFGLASCSTFAGLRNLGNSCYLKSAARCMYRCGRLRADVSGHIQRAVACSVFFASFLKRKDNGTMSRPQSCCIRCLRARFAPVSFC